MKDQLIVDERMNQFGKDVLRWTDYDYVVINDDLQKCYLEVNRPYLQGVLDNHVSKN